MKDLQNCEFGSNQYWQAATGNVLHNWKHSAAEETFVSSIGAASIPPSFLESIQSYWNQGSLVEVVVVTVCAGVVGDGVVATLSSWHFLSIDDAVTAIENISCKDALGSDTFKDKIIFGWTIMTHIMRVILHSIFEKEQFRSPIAEKGAMKAN